MINEMKLTTLDKIHIHLNVLDSLKEKAKGLDEKTSAILLHEVNKTFNLTRHGLEVEIRLYLKELELNNTPYLESKGA